MANLTRFEPFSSFNRLNPFAEMMPFGDDFFRRFMSRPAFTGMDLPSQIPIDVSEDDQSYVVKAEIPGAKKEEIKVSVDGNQVRIDAEIKREREAKEGTRLLRSECYCGSLSRVFSLDQEIDQGAVRASYNDGVLEMTLPKKPGSSSREITIT